MVESRLSKTEVESIGVEQLRTISSNFTRELRDAQAGEKTSLAFIPHGLSSSPLVKDGETFQSLVIGGTVGKIATLKKSESAVNILYENEERLSFKTEGEFLDFISNKILDNVDTVALNFAQALKPVFADGKLDGILLGVSKEGKFRGLIGKQIGQAIENYVLAKRNKKIRVAVANDTVCLLTSGLTKFQAGELAGGIVGTGLNLAFFLSENKLVNLESGNFDKFSQTETGKKVDEESSQPGTDLFEKETAGAYLYQHFNFILQKYGINYPALTSTEQLDEISRTNIPQASRIAQNLFKRSAQFVACQIAGIVAFQKKNLVFNMEGSLFWKGNSYKQTVEETVKQLTPEYKVDFVEIENSAILGAAKLIG